MPNCRRPSSCTISSSSGSKRRSSTSHCGTGSAATCARPASVSGCGGTNKSRKSTSSVKKDDCTSGSKKVVAKHKPNAVKSVVAAAAKKATQAKNTKKATSSSACRPCVPARGRKSRCYSSCESDSSSCSSFSDDCFSCSSSECEDY